MNVFKSNRILSMLTLVIVVIAGCKKFDNPPPNFEELVRQSSIARKVLLISIDGVTGTELKAVNAPTIMGLLPTSKYTFSSFKSAISTDAASWTSMLTGVPFNKHQVKDDNFQPTEDISQGEHGAVPIRRNVMDLIISAKDVKTAFVTPWVALRDYVKITDYRPIVSTDQEVKDSTVAILNNYSNIGTVVANFRDVEVAGANGGYLASNQVYKDAILKADGFVKEILDAVKARKTYADEDWLVIVTTNHGGSSDNPTNGFLIASHPRFKSAEIVSSGYSSVLFEGKSIFAQIDNAVLYDAGDGKDFTVQAQVKVVTPSTGYVGFLSKGSSYVDEKAGWSWGTWQSGGVNQWRNYLPGGRYGADRGNISDPAWHTLTMSVKQGATTRLATYYFDGVPGAADNIDWKSFTSKSSLPLKVGWVNLGSGTELKYYVANLAYFQTALDEATIKANLGLKDITAHPKYADLIGFWKMDEGAEGYFGNSIPGRPSMTLYGPYIWNKLATDAPSQSTFPPVVDGYAFKPTTSDITAMMLYWMNVKIIPAFDINGYPFIKDFEQEFVQ